jgi:hypothetical protein
MEVSVGSAPEVTVTLAVPDCDASAAEVAVMVTVPGETNGAT